MISLYKNHKNLKLFKLKFKNVYFLKAVNTLFLLKLSKASIFHTAIIKYYFQKRYLFIFLNIF